MTQRSLKSDPPSLELDIGYSIQEQKPSIKLKIPKGYFSGGRSALLFPLRTLRVWRLRLRARCDARRGIPAGTGQVPSIIEEVRHQGQLKFNEISMDICEQMASELPRKIQEMTPVPFSLEERERALRSSLQGWLTGYREFLHRVKGDLDKSRRDFDKAEEALAGFVKTEKVPRRPRARRPSLNSVSALLACMAAESMLGFFLFLDAQQSPIDGAVIALLVSVSNSFLGWLMGSFAVHQFLDGSTWWRRALGGVFSCVNATAAVTTNLLVAHKREGGLLSLDHVLPTSAFGCVLFVAGVCVWNFAAIKGYREFSPGKLGHREVWDDWREKKATLSMATARYRSLMFGFQKSAEEIARQLRSALERIVVLHEIRRDQIKSLLCDCDCLRAHLKIAENGVQESVKVLLANYWEANSIRSRSTPALASGAPLNGSATSDWKLAQFYPLTKADETAVSAQELITDNIKQVRQLQVAFEEEFAKVLSERIPAIMAEFPGEEGKVVAGAGTAPKSSGQNVVTAISSPQVVASGGI